MAPRAPDNSHLRYFTFAGVVIFALLAIAWWQTTLGYQPRFCSVCMATSMRRTAVFHGKTVRTWDTETEASEATKNYFDRYLGYPHKHLWNTGDGHGRDAYTLMAYQLVAASGITDPGLRRRYFEDITRRQDQQHRDRVLKTWTEIHQQIPVGSPAEAERYRVWGPEMEGITIPAEVKAGGLLPD